MPELNHVGIIPDGNRRYAKKQGWKPWKGHELGYKKAEDLLDWCKELEIKELTFWMLSTENFNRDKQEVDFLMDIFREKFDEFIENKKLDEDEVKVRFIGRLHLFPQDIQDKMESLMEKTKNHDKFILNFAAAYGGRAEIVDATKELAKKVVRGNLRPADIDEDVFSEHLYMKDEPDLIIRTSERRLSGFLPYQSDYSEIIFIDKLWPEFSKEDFVSCVNDFRNRERRFGN